MKYKIVSEKVGVVGEEFVPGDGINIEALLAHGFIVHDKTTPKSAKTITPAKKD
jgi:hypothetical protein